MRRRDATIALVAIGGLPLAARAQQAGKVYKIGLLSAGRPPFNAEERARLPGELRKLGWIEGKNYVLERRYAEDRNERLPALAAELAGLRVDVIWTVGTPASLAAKRATGTIPIVMFAVGDPVENGLVTSLARPGGNVTGNTMMSPEIAGKRLQLLKEMLPGITRVAIFWNAGNPYSANVHRESEGAARRLGLQLLPFELRTPEDFDRASEKALHERAAALIVVEDTLTADLRKRFADFAARNRLPAIYGFKLYVEAGGLMSYGASVEDLLRRGVAYVDLILKGEAKPGDLPVEQPTKFQMVVNLKAARQIGLTLPGALLVRADEVFE